MSSKKNVLFLVPYPLQRAPSQRFRVELFLPRLKQEGIDFRVHSFLDDRTWELLYRKGSPVRKMLGVIRGFFARLFVVLFVAPGYEFIFIHREAAPLGPPIFEAILAKLMRKKIIYDFDDAIWIPNTSSENSFSSLLKAFWKVKYICRWSYRIAAGNRFLAEYAGKYGGPVTILPTCVDTETQHNRLKDQYTSKVVIGWTGSHSTLKYLEALLPLLKKLSTRDNIEILVISNKKPEFDIPDLRFIPWTEATEVEDLMQLNIGLMPLESDAWSEGKCGFKLIQYMALGIPALASPVGVNKEIIDEGVNGYLCISPDEWERAVEQLINDAALRMRLGKAGRLKIESGYSLSVNTARFIALFK